jgi:hypothetical protein
MEDLIFIKATINGVEGRFLFDNGFSLSAVNNDFAEKAGIRFSKSTKINDANNKSSKALETTVDTVILLGHSFVKTGFIQTNTKKYLPCYQIDGVIGGGIINKVNWEIDFDNKLMRASSKAFKNEGQRLKVSYSGNNGCSVN